MVELTTIWPLIGNAAAFSADKLGIILVFILFFTKTITIPDIIEACKGKKKTEEKKDDTSLVEVVTVLSEMKEGLVKISGNDLQHVQAAIDKLAEKLNEHDKQAGEIKTVCESIANRINFIDLK